MGGALFALFSVLLSTFFGRRPVSCPKHLIFRNYYFSKREKQEDSFSDQLYALTCFWGLFCGMYSEWASPPLIQLRFAGGALGRWLGGSLYPPAPLPLSIFV